MNKFIDYILSRRIYFVVFSLLLSSLTTVSSIVGSYARAGGSSALSAMFVLIPFLLNCIVVTLFYFIWSYRVYISSIFAMADAFNLVRSSEEELEVCKSDPAKLALVTTRELKDVDVKYLIDSKILDVIGHLKYGIDNRCVLVNLLGGEELHCIVLIHMCGLYKYLSKLIDQDEMEYFLINHTTIGSDNTDNIVAIDIMPIIYEINKVLAAHQLGKIAVLDVGASSGGYKVIYCD